MGIEYRTFAPEVDSIQERNLFQLCFPETAGTSAQETSHHTWKYDEFPDERASYRYVATDGNAVIGFYAALPYTYSIGGTLYRCGMVCDVMTHPDHRGRGIFSGIGRFSTQALEREGLSFTTGYPIRPEVVPGHLRVGWRVVGKLPTYIRPIGVRTFLHPTLRFATPLIDWALNFFQFWTLSAPESYSAQTLTRTEFFDRFGAGASTYEAFIEEWIASQDNALVKSIDFIKWRTGAPAADYRFILLWKSGSLVGIAIARPTVLRNVETLAILDFMVLPSHYDGSRALHLELRQLALSLGKDAIACMISANWAKNYKFHGSAYIRSPAAFSLIVKKLEDSLEDSVLFEAKRWHLCWIDSDDL